MLTVKIEKDISLVKACTGGYLQMTCWEHWCVDLCYPNPLKLTTDLWQVKQTNATIINYAQNMACRSWQKR
jgi:hypothetical protein